MVPFLHTHEMYMPYNTNKKITKKLYKIIDSRRPLFKEQLHLQILRVYLSFVYIKLYYVNSIKKLSSTCLHTVNIIHGVYSIRLLFLIPFFKGTFPEIPYNVCNIFTKNLYKIHVHNYMHYITTLTYVNLYL